MSASTTLAPRVPRGWSSGGAPRIVVVGGGVGGLAAAVRLSASGARVLLLERAATPGGKLRQVEVGGRLIDAGPTVVTMPHVFEELFAQSGSRLADHVTLRPLAPSCRHFFPDGSRLDLWNDHERSREAIREFAGDSALVGFDAFTAHAARIYDFVRETFMENAAPTSVFEMLSPRNLRMLPAMLRIDASRTLWRALGDFFPDERLRVLFGRYATYNGSSPMHAPGTLAVIAHVELAFGVHSVEGGIRRLAEALADRARTLGAEIHGGAEVERVLVEGGRAAGVICNGERIEADAVVANCDAVHLYGRLLDGLPAAARAARKLERLEPSLSAFLMLAVAAVGDAPLVHHNVFFGGDYHREFRELIDERIPPADPTVYLCAGDRLPGAAAAGPERFLLLTNAPAVDVPHERIDWSQEAARCRIRMLETLSRSGLRLAPLAERLVTPAEMARLFPSSRGAIYGASSNARTAAFERPANRSPICRGLYCVGGSAHPGAGLPMVTLSARIATQMASADLGLRPSKPQAATPGGT